MHLKEYKKKRDLMLSKEPQGTPLAGSSQWHFCIQKHAARHLHYDFRLEHQGVLLSWAVPKGPPLVVNEKRLAIQVEDHPIEYQYFEGEIPTGSYGAGTVEIWDHGIFEVLGKKRDKEGEQALTEGLKAGHFIILIKGKRLKGEYLFQRFKKDVEERNWLLIKLK